jgi:hypothetical protein
MTSANGQYYALVQSDGNLCVYQGTYDNPVGNALWCALGESQCLALYYVEIQPDANLCVYSGTSDPAFQANTSAIWCSMSNVSDPPVQCFLTLENDGDLNIYYGTPANPGNLIWGTPT